MNAGLRPAAAALSGRLQNAQVGALALSANEPREVPGRWMRQAVDPSATWGSAALLRRIEADLPQLSPQLRKVADYLLRERGLPHRLRITEFARLTATAPVTVVRLAKRYGFQGFYELKFAFLVDAADLTDDAAMADAGGVDHGGTGLGNSAVNPGPSCAPPPAQAALQALQDTLHSVGALQAVVTHPAFLRAARWVHDADGVQVSASQPADQALAAHVVQALQLAGLRANAHPGRSQQPGLASASELDLQVEVKVRAELEVPSATGAVHNRCAAAAEGSPPAGRRIVVTRSDRPTIEGDGRSLTLGLAFNTPEQALPVVSGLLAALIACVEAVRSGH